MQKRYKGRKPFKGFPEVLAAEKETSEKIRTWKPLPVAVAQKYRSLRSSFEKVVGVSFAWSFAKFFVSIYSTKVDLTEDFLSSSLAISERVAPSHSHTPDPTGLGRLCRAADFSGGPALRHAKTLPEGTRKLRESDAGGCGPFFASHVPEEWSLWNEIASSGTRGTS